MSAMESKYLYAENEVRSCELAVTTAQEKLSRAKAELSRMRSHCRHRFSETKYDPVITPGGSSPGDPPGTMGVDWRGPATWPETKKDRWSRTCSECGTVEYTTKSEPVPRPVW